VIDSVYRTQLSDRALDWLTDHAVITTVQRTTQLPVVEHRHVAHAVAGH
jgi:hypothetical protein